MKSILIYQREAASNVQSLLSSQLPNARIRKYSTPEITYGELGLCIENVSERQCRTLSSSIRSSSQLFQKVHVQSHSQERGQSGSYQSQLQNTMQNFPSAVNLPELRRQSTSKLSVTTDPSPAHVSLQKKRQKWNAKCFNNLAKVTILTRKQFLRNICDYQFRAISCSPRTDPLHCLYRDIFHDDASDVNFMAFVGIEPEIDELVTCLNRSYNFRIIEYQSFIIFGKVVMIVEGGHFYQGGSEDLNRIQFAGKVVDVVTNRSELKRFIQHAMLTYDSK